jgi:hypothetical protein
MHRRNIFMLRAMYRYPRATLSLPGRAQLLSMFRLVRSAHSSATLHHCLRDEIESLDSIDGSARIADTEPFSTALLGFRCPSQC